MRLCQSLRLSKLDLDALDKGLTSMVLIRALPDDYSHFVSSLLLLDKLDKETITQAFLTQEIQRRRRATDAANVSAAAMGAAAAASPTSCQFCGISGHVIASCFKFQRAKADASKPRGQHGHRAKKTSTPAQETTNGTPATPAVSQEFAGNASAVPDLVDPLSLIQPHADFHWNADSGCTSTMTPHKH